MRFDRGKKHGALFIAVTMLWTWCILFVPVLLGFDYETTVTKLAYTLAGVSPSVAGLIFVLSSGDRVYIHSFLRRTVRLGKLRGVGLTVVFALVPTVKVLSAYTNQLFTSTPPDWSTLSSYFEDPINLIAFAIFTLAFGPLAEEIGWRGYLLDCWKDRGILVYGAGIGFIWTVWHLPMFFIAGSYQNSLLMRGTEPVLFFALSTIALSIIIGKVTIQTNSILTAILFHFTINFTGELIPLAPVAEMINTVALLIIALGIIYSHHHIKKSGYNEEVS